MPDGQVQSIYIRPAESAPVEARTEVTARVGFGIDGDYAAEAARAAHAPRPPKKHLTLIEQESIDAIARDNNITLAPGESRRNIITTGVALNHFVGREFMVGDVRARGIELNEPCAHLEAITYKGIVSALLHRGGLRAEILNDGMIREGDAVRAV